MRHSDPHRTKMEKELTFTFEDALISPLGMSILMGAGLGESKKYQHHVLIKTLATSGEDGTAQIDVSDELMELAATLKDENGDEIVPTLSVKDEKVGILTFVYHTDALGMDFGEKIANPNVNGNIISGGNIAAGEYYYVDGYVEMPGTELTIEANKFSDAFYIEAETLFRRENDNTDRAAQLIFPKGKISSNFTLSMANSGDPSTFTFTIDAMEDVVKGTTKKVLCAINILD